jgi:hypothetical protein
MDVNDVLPLTKLFAPDGIAEYLGIKWTDGSSSGPMVRPTCCLVGARGHAAHLRVGRRIPKGRGSCALPGQNGEVLGGVHVSRRHDCRH